MQMNPEQVNRHLRRANEVARQALAKGHHPFGAILVAPDLETVLLEQGNVDTVNHAESVLARIAAEQYAPDFFMALYPGDHRGALRHVCGYPVLGEHWQAGVWAD